MSKKASARLFGFRSAIPHRWYFSIAVTSIALLGVAWALLCAFEAFPSAFFPPPGRVVSTAIRMFTSQDFLIDIVASCGRIGFAFLLSVLLAVPLGIFMSSFKSVEALVEPLVDF